MFSSSNKTTAFIIWKNYSFLALFWFLFAVSLISSSLLVPSSVPFSVVSYSFFRNLIFNCVWFNSNYSLIVIFFIYFWSGWEYFNFLKIFSRKTLELFFHKSISRIWNIFRHGSNLSWIEFKETWIKTLDLWMVNIFYKKSVWLWNLSFYGIWEKFPSLLI